MATLRDLCVASPVDARLTPLSRKPGLSHIELGEAPIEHGIRYAHPSALGNPKDNRGPFCSGDVADGCTWFTQLLARPDSAAAMGQLEALSRYGLAAALCFEREHERCPRQVIADQLSVRLVGLATVIHAVKRGEPVWRQPAPRATNTAGALHEDQQNFVVKSEWLPLACLHRAVKSEVDEVPLRSATHSLALVDPSGWRW